MRPGDDMTCNEIVEVVTDYLEGAMPQPDRQRFEAHLESCPFCTEYVVQMRQVAGSLGGLREDSIAPEKRESLIEAFRGWRDV
jgi:anti-sigma factor RsiW